MKKNLLDKYKYVCASLLNMERVPVYVGKKEVGRLIGIELNNVYCGEIIVIVESKDYQEIHNRLLKDVSFKK